MIAFLRGEPGVEVVFERMKNPEYEASAHSLNSKWSETAVASFSLRTQIAPEMSFWQFKGVRELIQAALQPQAFEEWRLVPDRSGLSEPRGRK